MKITSYQFGKIAIEGQTYSADLIITPQEVIVNWWRKEGHHLCLDDLKGAFTETPAVVIIGTGAYGVMTVGEDVKAYLKDKGIELVAVNTFEAVRLYNELSTKKKVICALHLTC
jgi:hypothetical protein